MGFFDDILIPPESLQQPAKLYPHLKYSCRWSEIAVISSQQQFFHIIFVHYTLFVLYCSRIDCDCSWSSCSSRAVESSLSAASVMKQSKFGFGSMRRMKEPMTSTWTKERRSGFGWQMKCLWIRRRRARPLQQQAHRRNRDSRRRRQQRTAGRRKRHRTLWS